MSIQSLHHQAVIYLIKESFDVHVYYLVSFPTILSGFSKWHRVHFDLDENHMNCHEIKVIILALDNSSLLLVRPCLIQMVSPAFVSFHFPSVFILVLPQVENNFLKPNDSRVGIGCWLSSTHIEQYLFRQPLHYLYCP